MRYRPSPPRALSRRRPRAGFSLVELFTVMLVLALLAGLAIPRYRQYKHRYYLAAMLGDLENLALTQEAYWHDEGTYTADLSALKYYHSPDVTVAVVSADPAGWSALATHARDASKCAVYYGAATPPPPATVRTLIACD